MELRIRGLDTALVDGWRDGAPDANGQASLVRAAAPANPCRHCLQLIAPGDEMLVLAHRPFEAPQPYAELGPIFVHRGECPRYDAATLPDWCAYLEPALVRAYDARHWIDYERSDAVAGPRILDACRRILAHPEVDTVHLRSKYGCFQCRIDRGAA